MTVKAIAFNRAFLWILVSVLLVSGSSLMGWQYYLLKREKKFRDEQYHIVALVQSTPQTESLTTAYLAELLDLSLDRPTNLYQFNIREAERKLALNPLIKKASVRKILPGTVYVDYEMREPIAYLADYANTAIDAEGFLFPFRPFFTPKRLPSLYLGLDKAEEEIRWGSSLRSSIIAEVVLSLKEELKILEPLHLIIKWIDVSQAKASSYGQRQLVIVLQQPGGDLDASGKNYYLRLNSTHYAQNIRNFRTLYSEVLQGDQSKFKTAESLIVDMRIPQLAFLK